MTRKHKDGDVSYDDPAELLHFFTSSSNKALYMWSNSEDLAIISDMHQIKIKIITTKGREDMNPTVYCIHPN